MQPTFRQVPPNWPDSARAIRRSRYSRPMIVLPEPVPTTTRSKCMRSGYVDRPAATGTGCSVGEHRGDDRPGEGVEHQVERDHRRAGRGVRAEPWHVHRVHHEEVAVHLVALRRGGTVVAGVAEVVAHVEGAVRQRSAGATRATWQF